MSEYCGRQLYWHRWGRTQVDVRFDRRTWLIGVEWFRGLSQAGDEFGLTLRPLPMVEIHIRRCYGWPAVEGE